MAINKKNLNFVEQRLMELKSLKDKYNLTDKGRIWKEKANMKEETATEDENDFRTQVSATVKRQKDAELSANMPEYSFIPLSDEGQVNRRIVRETWGYHWLMSNSDKQIGKVIKSATTYGTGILYDGIKHTLKKVKEPYVKDVIVEGETIKVIDFKEKIIQKSRIYCEKIPFLNFFINGTDIDNSTEAVVIRYIDKDDYIDEKTLNPFYKNISQISSASKTYTLTGITDWEDIQSGWSNENTVTELSYYNSAKDMYIVLANGIEVLNTHIPYMHKELPFCPYYDNEAEDRFWGIGEFELLAPDELAKNEYRSLTIQAVKSAIGFIIKEAWADFEVSDINFGIGEVVETDDIEGIQHFAPNTPIQAISELEFKIDNDIIAKSGVDFKALHLTPNESATKTANKQGSTKKRINLNIKDNGFSFFRRLGELRLSNIQQLHMMEPRRIPMEWGSLRNDGVFIRDETGSFGSGIIGANFIKWDFLVLPITESMLGNNKERRKENLLNFMQTSGNLMDDEMKPVIKGKQLAKLACDEFGYDFEKLTESSSDAQTAEQAMDDVFWEKGQAQPWENPNDPNYVPPAQRSRPEQVKTISGQAKIPYEQE